MMRRMTNALWMVPVMALVAASHADQPLPSDGRVKSGMLENGVQWLYRQHSNPPGKMMLMIHVDTGSLNETDAQRGLAHFLEHMAFNGTEHFAPGELVPYFESIGMQFGADLNAFTSFDQTAYMLFLPDTKTETVDEALKVLSDWAFRQSLVPEEIEKERGVILEELRAGQGAQQRIRDATFEQVFDGMRLGKRLPIGTEEVIKNADRDLFLEYYRTWYRPENVTLMMVGDAPCDAYVPLIEQWFGQYRAEVPAQPQNPAGLKPFARPRVIVVTDKEYTDGDIALYRLDEGGKPTTTVADYRRDLVDDLASWIMARRFEERIKEGKATFRQASTGSASFLNDALMSTANAVGAPDKWEQMVDELLVEIDRTLEHGFLAKELELARKELLAIAERRMETDSTRNARAFLFEMNNAVNREEPIMSAQQMQDLYKQLLPTITLKELSETFRQRFGPGNFTLVLTLPEQAPYTEIAEADVLQRTKKVLAQQTEPPTWREAPTEILASDPTPGKVVESTTDDKLQITSMWLDNGACVHHRHMDYKKDTIFVSVSLAGGQIEETVDNLGVSQVAGLCMRQPATGRLRSSDIVDIMTGKKVQVAGNVKEDTLTFFAWGSPKDIELGLQLIHALITDGKIEESVFRNWQQAALTRWEDNQKNTRYRAYERLYKTISGDDPRWRMLDKATIESQSIPRAQAWLERICANGPIEVAVVGDMLLRDVQPMIEQYIGSLPARPRSNDRLATLRMLQRPAGPLVENVQVETMTPKAMMLYGFMSADQSDAADVRVMELASYTLDSRLIEEIREDKGMAYSIQAKNQPSAAYKDSGFMVSAAPCEPGGSSDFAMQVEVIFDDFAEYGPSETELENAKKQVANDLDNRLKEPAYWFTQIQHLTLHDRSLEEFYDLEEKYAAITKDDILRVFNKYYNAERKFTILAEPTMEPDEQASVETEEETAAVAP
jgi:zinc protease